MYEEREQKGSKTKLTLSPPKEGGCSPSSTARCSEVCNRNTQLMVREQHEQMVLQHSHVACIYTHHHLLSNPLPLFSFLVTNYYILTFYWFLYRIKPNYALSGFMLQNVVLF